MGGLLHLVHIPLLAVPNVTAHPTTASVPIIVGLLLRNGPLLCGFHVPVDFSLSGVDFEGNLSQIRAALS